jgi:DNA-binding helix-hairpin-helix protein with protein kinase domain
MFMAPEIVNGLAAPSTRTDLWSMAVLLFHAFVLHHPLLGRHELDFPILSERAQRQLFGTQAVFIFDPDNTVNAPLPGVHDTAIVLWSILPSFLRDLFVRAFTAGLHEPAARVMEPEWRNAMVRLRDQIMRCPGCRAENFYEDSQSGSQTCWNCHALLQAPWHITIDTTRVVLSDDAVLFPHHVDPARRLDFSAPMAVFSRHPSRPDLVGLQNRGKRPWRAVLADGQEFQIDEGRTIGLQRGTRIVFGNAQGVIG